MSHSLGISVISSGKKMMHPIQNIINLDFFKNKFNVFWMFSDDVYDLLLSVFVAHSLMMKVIM